MGDRASERKRNGRQQQTGRSARRAAAAAARSAGRGGCVSGLHVMEEGTRHSPASRRRESEQGDTASESDRGRRATLEKSARIATPSYSRPQDIRRQLCGSPPRSPSPPQPGADAGDGKENGTGGDAEAEHNGRSAAEVEPPRPRLVAEFRLVRRESAAYAGRSWAYAFSPYPHTPPPLQPL